MELNETIAGALSEDEVLALEILEKKGWKIMQEVYVEKAIADGYRFPSYHVEKRYLAGVMLDTISGREPALIKKRGRPKKVSQG